MGVRFQETATCFNYPFLGALSPVRILVSDRGVAFGFSSWQLGIQAGPRSWKPGTRMGSRFSENLGLRIRAGSPFPGTQTRVGSPFLGIRNPDGFPVLRNPGTRSDLFKSGR
jgi:hypothetical protein